MATLSTDEIEAILTPFYPMCSAALLEKLSMYLDLLVKWNLRTNLSAIRDPREMVKRHFGESLFLARHLPEAKTLLDLGSGAGFPGLPVQLARPALRVTLSESQNKKASFLREVVRTLELKTEVWASRVEDLPPDRVFDVVTLRAVDRPELALELARARLALGGVVMQLSGRRETQENFLVPGARESYLSIIR